MSLLGGITSYRAHVFIQDSSQTDGRGLTGLVFNSASLVASYARPGAVRTAITLATQTVTGAYSSGGFVEVDATNMPGVYRLDIPDAALAAGIRNVLVMLKGAANMAPCVMEFELTAVDNQDAVRFGLSALPNVAAGANGGLPLGNASGQTTVAGTAAGAIVAASFAAGAIDAAAIATDAIGSAELATSAVTEIQAAVAAGAVASVTGAVGSVTAGVTVTTNNDKTGYGLSGAAVQAIWDALTSALTTVGSIGKRLADDIDATISSRNAVAPDNASVATILTRTDVATSTRLSTAGYTAPPSAATISTTVWGETTRTLTSISALASQIADAVWNAVATSYNVALSMGNKLNAAGSAGDPWTTALPGAYGAGTAGKIVGDNVNATISSRLASASYTAPPSAASISTTVWGETTRALTDKVGFALSAAGVQAVWDALTSALTTVGSVGKRIADNLDAAVSSRNAVAPDNTSVATILARTDVATSTRLATSGYTAPPSAAAVSTTVWAETNRTITSLTAAPVDEILDDPIGDGSLTLRQAIRVLVAGMVGKLSGAATTTVTIRNAADTQNVVVATVTADGDRTAVTVMP